VNFIFVCYFKANYILVYYFMMNFIFVYYWIVWLEVNLSYSF